MPTGDDKFFLDLTRRDISLILVCLREYRPQTEAIRQVYADLNNTLTGVYRRGK